MMDLKSHSKEGADHKNTLIEEGTAHFSKFVDENEKITLNEKDFPLPGIKDDSKDLESVQKYAQKIKSFLGWEPNIESFEPKSEKDELEKKSIDENVIENSTDVLSSNSETTNDEKPVLKEILCISNKGAENSESMCDTLNNGKSSFIIPEGKIRDLSTSESDDDLVQEPKPEVDNNNSLLYKNYDNVPFAENLMDEKLECLNSPVSVGHEEKSEYTEDKVKNSENEGKNLEFVPKELDPSCTFELKAEILLDEDGRKNEGDMALKSDLLIHKNESKVSEALIENKNHTAPENSLPSVTNVRENEDLPLKLINSSENDMGDLENQKEIIDIRAIKREDSLELYEELDNGLENINDTNNVSCDIKSEDCFDLRINGCNSKEKERCESNDIDDLRSEDSLDFNEFFNGKDNLPKDYIKGIRRLSREIIKEVMESARSSVHEICVNNIDDLDITLLSESLKSDLLKDTQELYFSKYEENPNILSEFKVTELTKRNSPRLKSNNKLEGTRSQVEKDLNIGGKDDICGCGCFHPNWIQKYATPRIFLTFYGIVGIVHAIFYTYIVSVMSTLEKRYAFKAKVSGTILFADEVAPLILGSIVGYFGGKAHRPRMVALGMLISAVCYFIYGIPYFIYGSETHFSNFAFNNKTSLETCTNNLKSIHCGTDMLSPTKTAVSIFILASFVRGFSSVMYYVLGMSYMDDIIKKRNSAMYFAIALALRLLGPLVGFLMSSGFLKYYENPFYDPGFGPDDPRWIGAWWMGFFLQGILLVIFTIPIALFPRRLPGQKKIEKVDVAASEDGFKEILTGLISALKRLGKNPVFIVLIINTTMKIFGHFGHAIMLPKYMENQFRLSASEASLYSGATTIVCIILSTLLGGFLIWKFTPRIKVLLGGMIASEAILCVGYLILMIPRCQTSEMVHFGMNEEGLILNSVCNNNCDCSTSSFTPFCGPDGKTLYFSPCYAGCNEEVTSLTSPKTNKIFANCSCVDQQQVGGTITEGFCPDENCRSQTIFYLVILFFLVTISNLFTVAATMILLRSVHPSDKSVALGTFETFICLFGFIPFPVTFGALVDSACLVWEKSCGETGNCWFYDMDKYGYLLHGASALFCFLSVICLIMLYFLSPRVRNLYIEEDEDEEEAQTKYVDIKLDTVSGSVTKL